MRDVQAFLQKASDKLQSNILNALSKLGDECVARVRNRPNSESWIDRTGNLRSSIGFAVYEHGRTFIQSSFPVVLNGAEGSMKAKKMIADMAKEYSRVYALVVIAAMDYAEDVEAIESKDVLESTRIWAASVVEQRVKNAVDDAVKQINTWTI